MARSARTRSTCAIRKMIVDAGIDVTLDTADGSEPEMLAGG
jgi:hypothetical protein